MADRIGGNAADAPVCFRKKPVSKLGGDATAAFAAACRAGAGRWRPFLESGVMCACTRPAASQWLCPSERAAWVCWRIRARAEQQQSLAVQAQLRSIATGGLQAILSRDGVAGNSRKWRRGEGGTASEWCCCIRDPAVLVAGNRVASQLAVACWPASAAGVKWPRHILRPRVCSSPAPARCRLPAWEQARQPLAREACHTTCPARAARRGLTQTHTLVPAWPPRFETTRRMTPRRSRSGSHTCAQQLRRAQRSARCPRRLRHPRPGPKLVARAYPLIPGPARLKQSCGALGNGGRDPGRGLGGVRNCQAAQQ